MTDETEFNDPELSVMAFFILALIAKAGLTSLYAFQQRAGLQPGGIRIALQRLESLKLITRAESSTRNRRAMALTPEGMEFLNRSWERCLDQFTDSEGVLRAACVALLMGAPELAAQYLEKLANFHEGMANERNFEMEKLEKTRRKEPLSTYAWMRALTEYRRRSAESKAFSELGHLLEGNHKLNAEQQP